MSQVSTDELEVSQIGLYSMDLLVS